MHGVDGFFFGKNSLRWPISFLKWPVWPASSDWRPKGPCAVLSSDEQCKLWANKTSLFRQLVSWVWHWRLHCPLHKPWSYLWVVSSANTTPQIREFYLTSPSQKSNSLTLLLNCCCWLDSFRCWLFSLDFCTKYSHCCWSLVILSLTISSLPAHFRCSIRPEQKRGKSQQKQHLFSCNQLHFIRKQKRHWDVAIIKFAGILLSKSP